MVGDTEMLRAVVWSLLGILAALKNPSTAPTVAAYGGGVMSVLLDFDKEGWGRGNVVSLDSKGP